jgi:uncharacterized protein YprB with RNaseH-like and TPR domain
MSWGLWVNGALNHDSVVQERSIICGSWKWLGEKKVHSVAIDVKNPTDDAEVVGVLHGIVSSADAVVHHHGDSFDLPWLKARSVFYDLPPIPPLIQIDTRKLAKKAFYFNSNKLDYLAKFLGFGRKLKTDFDLWKKCLAGDQSALDKMVRYNKRDVLLLEKIYKRLVPHIPAPLNRVLFVDREVCQNCGSSHVQYRGFYYTPTSKFRRYQCMAKGCGTWSRSTKKEKR